jgi:hypothetical protein
MRHLLVGVAMSLCFALPAAFGAGCQGKVLFQDKFAQANPAWNLASSDSAKIAVQGGKLVLNLVTAATMYRNLYQGDVYDDVDICANIGSLASDKPEEQLAGVMFWAKDYNSFYAFLINPAGQFKVMRYAAGRWLTPLPSQDAAAIKKGTGQVNSLHVATRGEQATLYINDQQVGTVSGHPADGGSMVGLYGESATKSPDTWEYTDFIISKP